MADWADEKAEHALCSLCNVIAVSRDDIDTIAQALRQARLDALEEAAKVADEYEGKGFELGLHTQSGDAYVTRSDIAAAIRALKENSDA